MVHISIVKLTIMALIIKVCVSIEKQCSKTRIFRGQITSPITLPPPEPGTIVLLLPVQELYTLHLCQQRITCEPSEDLRLTVDKLKIRDFILYDGVTVYAQGGNGGNLFWLNKENFNELKERKQFLLNEHKGTFYKDIDALINQYTSFYTYTEELCIKPTTTTPTTTTVKGAEGEKGDADGGAEGEKGGKQPTGSDRGTVAKLPGTELPVIWLVPILYPFGVIGVFVYLVYFKPKGRKNDDEPRASESSNAIELTEASKQSAPSQQSAAGKQSFMSGKQSTAGNRSVKSLSSNRDSGSIQGGDRMSMMSAKSKASGRSFY